MLYEIYMTLKDFHSLDFVSFSPYLIIFLRPNLYFTDPG